MQLDILKHIFPFVAGTVKEWVAGMGRESWSSGNGAKAEQCIVSEMK